jgi:hypothetical protein
VEWSCLEDYREDVAWPWANADCDGHQCDQSWMKWLNIGGLARWEFCLQAWPAAWWLNPE